MSKDKIYHEHLVRNIPNTEDNRKCILNTESLKMDLNMVVVVL